ncbi:hypothetical protein M899_1074 [Bacteriovorax sp. BSW11_IV]|uniref:hypothetical protein n=1 Tax=Bacteriovorax sp. BSW11_IV TaxID=1353529 RepID=UPI00038A4DC1|nr:hypothetical protein [Bacteriovorax sp. BSW11_IV]EQC45179.1 hypothetical protein M899_1074 [Bacteriovorax sp. BSW11_IV]
MINAYNDLFKLKEKVKFYGIRPTENEVAVFENLFFTKLKIHQSKNSISINIFKERDEFFAEALIERPSGVEVFRHFENSLLGVAQKVYDDLKFSGQLQFHTGLMNPGLMANAKVLRTK